MDGIGNLFALFFLWVHRIFK